MAQHPYNQHREQQVAHRRVGALLKGHPAGAMKHADGDAFSKITSKTAAEDSDAIGGGSAPSRFARGGKVKGQTNIAIVLPSGTKDAPPAGPTAGPAMPPPGAGPGLPPPMPGPGPGMPPPPMRKSGGRVGRAEGGRTKVAGDVVDFPISMQESDARRTKGLKNPVYPAEPPKLPIKGPGAAARGGVIDGEATKSDNKKWSSRADKNSYARGGGIGMTAGAQSGEGRLQLSRITKKRAK